MHRPPESSRSRSRGIIMMMMKKKMMMLSHCLVVFWALSPLASCPSWTVGILVKHPSTLQKAITTLTWRVIRGSSSNCISSHWMGETVCRGPPGKKTFNTR
eukprot:6117064-Amphidinium_carterae.2